MPGTHYEWAAELPVLTTRRLRLRLPRERDAPALFEVFGDPDAMRYWSSPPMAAEAEAVELVRSIREGFRRREFFQWGLADRPSDALLGTVTLWKPDFQHARSELGFALRRDRWGQGLATEAVRAVLDFAFGPLGLHRVEADVDPRNVPSLEMLERLGFRREGMLRHRYFLHDEWQDSVILALLHGEWA